MSDVDRDLVSASYGPSLSIAEAAAIDAGLRAYMLRVYNYMVLGLAVTGVAALGAYLVGIVGALQDASYVMRGARVMAATAGLELQGRDILLSNAGYVLFVSPLKWAIMLAPLVLVFGLSFGIYKIRPATAQVMFWIFSALMGISLSVVFVVFAHTSIVRVFFVVAGAFVALSLWGYTSRRYLTGLGALLIMGLVGIVLAGIANAVCGGTLVQRLVSFGGVVVFAGLTAWDTRRLKSEYLYGAMEGEATERSAIMGALSLYLSFVNLFTLLLGLLGQRDH